MAARFWLHVAGPPLYTACSWEPCWLTIARRYLLRGPPLRGPESTTASTAKSDVALAHFLPGFSMSNNPAIVGTYSSIFMFVLERD